MLDIFLLSLIIIYIVDISGFTETLLKFCSKWMGRKVTELKPFTCSLCSSWWTGILYLLVTGTISLPLIAWTALCSMLTGPAYRILSLIREAILKTIDNIYEKI